MCDLVISRVVWLLGPWLEPTCQVCYRLQQYPIRALVPMRTRASMRRIQAIPKLHPRVESKRYRNECYQSDPPSDPSDLISVRSEPNVIRSRAAAIRVRFRSDASVIRSDGPDPKRLDPSDPRSERPNPSDPIRATQSVTRSVRPSRAAAIRAIRPAQCHGPESSRASGGGRRAQGGDARRGTHRAHPIPVPRTCRSCRLSSRPRPPCSSQFKPAPRRPNEG